MDRMNNKERARFNANVLSAGDCVLWTGRTDEDGYGVFWFRRKLRRAHRVSYWAGIGEIPSGNVVDHICGNRGCQKPEHLRCVSRRENTLLGDGVGAVNARKASCPKGHPYDRQYGKQRYCSICEATKRKMLRAKWRAEDTLGC